MELFVVQDSHPNQTRGGHLYPQDEAPRNPMPGEQETANPAPDKDYPDKEQPFTEGEENDPEIDDE